MKIAITGHTRGLGLACAELLGNEHEIVGLSTSNGFNINDTDSIIAVIETADVFINNAYSNYAQALLLDELYKRWQDLDKVIINIGSICTKRSRIEQHLDHMPWAYRDHKLALEKMFNHLIKENDTCRLHLLTPGAIDTSMTKHLQCNKLSPQRVAECVKLMLYNPDLKEITINAK